MIDCQQPYKEKAAFLGGLYKVLKTLFYVFDFIKYTIYFDETDIV